MEKDFPLHLTFKKTYYLCHRQNILIFHLTWKPTRVFLEVIIRMLRTMFEKLSG